MLQPGMAMLGANTSQPQGKETFPPASKFIALVEYDPKAMSMDVTFHSGSKIRYLRVFPSTFLSFKQSPTIDAYFSKAIKGKLMSVKLISKSIGRKEGSPLKVVKKEHTLDVGLRKRIAGTVAHAYKSPTSA